MRVCEPVVTWVVYEVRAPGKPKMTLVCEQPEWDVIQQTQPNTCVLIRADITNEGEAERLARSGAVIEKTKAVRQKAVISPADRDARHSAMTTFMDRCGRPSGAEEHSHNHNTLPGGHDD